MQISIEARPLRRLKRLRRIRRSRLGRALRKERKAASKRAKLADFVVLDRDLFGIDLDEIRHVRPVMTVVDGEVRFETAVGG